MRAEAKPKRRKSNHGGTEETESAKSVRHNKYSFCFWKATSSSSEINVQKQSSDPQSILRANTPISTLNSLRRAPSANDRADHLVAKPIIAIRYGPKHSLNKYEGILLSSKWQNGSKDLMELFLVLVGRFWVVPFTDSLPLNDSGWGFPKGNQAWILEGQNHGIAEMPAVRRWEGEPPTWQHVSRTHLEWQQQFTSFISSHCRKKRSTERAGGLPRKQFPVLSFPFLDAS